MAKFNELCCSAYPNCTHTQYRLPQKQDEGFDVVKTECEIMAILKEMEMDSQRFGGYQARCVAKTSLLAIIDRAISFAKEEERKRCAEIAKNFNPRPFTIVVRKEYQQEIAQAILRGNNA